MAKSRINFFSEDTLFTPDRKGGLRDWLLEAIHTEGFKLTELNFIFCSDNYLLEINKEYLKHTTLTDIITFDNSGFPGKITGDIFISIDRVNENAAAFSAEPRDELHRVMIHGTLHLLGYTDKTRSAKAVMTRKEDQYLALRSFI